MLSIVNVSSGQAGSYYSKDDYYKSEVGEWQGALREELGITSAQVMRDEFQSIVLEHGRIQGHVFNFQVPRDIVKDVATRDASSWAELLAAHRSAAIAANNFLAGQHGNDLARFELKDHLPKSTSARAPIRSEFITTNKKTADNKFYDDTRIMRSRQEAAEIYRHRLHQELNNRGINTANYKSDSKVLKVHERSIPRVAYDLTFSAPKSVSMLRACGDDARRIVEAAHSRAVERALSHAQELIHARIKEDGSIRTVHTGNMACATFTHHVSRNQDPQLHTHCVIANKTLCDDGTIRAIEPCELYRHKMILGQYYRNELARELQASGFEVRVADRDKGLFEAAGFSRDQIEAFSSRRLEIVAHLESAGRSLSAENCAEAVLTTRQAKEAEDLDVLIKSWRLTMQEQGINPDLTRRNRFISPNAEEIAGIMHRAEHGLSQQTFAFSEREFTLAALQQGLERGVTIADVRRHLAEASGSSLIRLGQREGDTFYTTPEAYRVEKAIIEGVERGRNGGSALDAKTAGQSWARFSGPALSAEQKMAAEFICTSQDRFVGVQGLAGTGKTTMLRAAREILEQNGYVVRGAAFAGKAAEGLHKEAGIEASTIHSFLNTLERTSGQARSGEDYGQKDTWRLSGLTSGGGREVWIIDEAGMVDNNLMRHLVEAAERCQAKVVFVGDAKQLPPIGAGNAFGALLDRGVMDFRRLEDIRRQRDDVLREAVRLAAGAGPVSESFRRLEDRIVQIADKRERLAVIAQEYAGQEEPHRHSSAILTAVNEDRRALNDLVRSELKAAGALHDGITITVQSGKSRRELEFSVGDRIIFLQNEKRDLRVMNGQTGIVRGIQDGRLDVETNGRRFRVDPYVYNKIDHGYALTVHKAQGATYDRVFVNANSDQRWANNRNAFYVEISRARHEAWIYTDDALKLAGQAKDFQKKYTALDFPELIALAPAGETNGSRFRAPETVRQPTVNLQLQAGQFQLDQTIRMAFTYSDARTLVRSAEQDRGLE